MFSERDDRSDLVSIILQFQALAKPDADDHHSRISCPTILLSGSEDGTHPSAAALKASLLISCARFAMAAPCPLLPPIATRVAA